MSTSCPATPMRFIHGAREHKKKRYLAMSSSNARLAPSHYLRVSKILVLRVYLSKSNQLEIP